MGNGWDGAGGGEVRKGRGGSGFGGGSLQRVAFRGDGQNSGS